MDDGALIQYKNVEIHQQELCVLSDVNLELHKGEFVYLIGKVGSGKTSLLKTLYGELDVIDGEAEVLGYNMRSIKRKHIPQLRRKLGIVFQDFQLLTDRTVYNNLEFVLRATGWKNKQEIQERIEEVLQLVGMSILRLSSWRMNQPEIWMWKQVKPSLNCCTISANPAHR